MKRVLAVLILLTTPMGCELVAAQSSENTIKEAVANAERSDADRERDGTSKPAEVLSFFRLKSGMSVLDLLSGGGYYSEILSYSVGAEGKVVAHTNDIYEKYHGQEIARRYRSDRLPNVKRLISNPPDLMLPSETFDIVLMVMTYHDIYYISEFNPKHPKIDRDRFFMQIQRCLKPGGILAVVDHAAKLGTGKDSAQDLHRIDEEFARKDIEAAGFVFDGESRVLRNPNDDRTLVVFDESIRRRTDRFVYRFVKK
jgi:predicted methyltransferase